ncbi:hypothetical protein DY000_02051903 [Brassica cretica]|uniref:Uncharacterized protein n=1 Tax=Brassica cretica TaxID=69181 RepID=A0ABQ7AHT4_BRACR|nr:hypothetical protein DY000_02051903 [Brassica cretica]
MDKEIVPFKETEGEQELANPIDDLTEGEMEEAMLENDDLLDEDFEIRTGEADETFEEGEIKALSHLLPDKAGRQQSPAHAPRPTRTKAEQTKDKKVAKGSKDDKAVRGALGYTNQTRKRGARSPEIKGTAASNKLATHLLPDKAGRQQSPAHAPRPTRTKAEQTKDKKVAKGSKDDKAVRGALGYTNQTRKRGARSPEIKGTAASNKLATRGRMSPKPKQMKPARDMMMATRQSTKVPRNEVYLSASRSRKTVVTSGSVVSQKLPSPLI